MKISKLSIVVILSLCFLAGCVNERNIDPHVAGIGEKTLLTSGKYDLAGSGNLNKFSMLLSADSLGAEKNSFLSKGVFNGYIAALVPEKIVGSGVDIVFRDGSVFKIEKADFTSLQPVLESPGNMEFLTAVRNNGNILALARRDKGEWKFYEFSAAGWVESTIPSPVLSIAQIGGAELSEIDNKPVLFWREAIGSRVEGIIRGAEYNGDGWEYLSQAGLDYPQSGGFAICSTGKALLLVQDIGGMKGISGNGMPLYEYTGDSGWRSLADIPLSKDSMELSCFGVDLNYIGDHYVFTRADEAGLQLYYAKTKDIEDGIWKRVEQFAEEEKDWFAFVQSEEIFNYLLIALSIILMVIFVRRRRKLRAALEAGNQNEAAAEIKDPRLLRMLKEARLQRIGGFASVIDRGFALFIDGFLVMPIPYFYLSAQNLDFVDSVFAAKEMVLFFIWLISLTVYLFIAELLFGQSVGKALIRVRVRSAAGGRATFYQILLRNTARIIDFFPIPIGGMRLWYLIATIAASVTGKRQRLGDILGKTVVRRYTPLKKRKLILASASPRRRELLSEFGLNFEAEPADVDESLIPGMPPREFAKMLAVRKAGQVAGTLESGELVLAADTVVALGDRIMGKPENDSVAESMLRELSGGTHEVFTGVCILDTAINQMVVSVERTEVEFYELSESEIADYIATGEGRDKAGSYGIQGRGGRFVKVVLGSTSNVIGLPMELLRRMFRDLDAS